MPTFHPTVATIALVMGMLAPSCCAGAETSPSSEKIIADISQREREFRWALQDHPPVVETYIQDLRPEAERGKVAASDSYFLGYLNLGWGSLAIEPLGEKPGRLRGFLHSVTGMRYNAAGFAIVSPDLYQFDSAHYQFTLEGREPLGEVHCLVFEVAPRKDTGKGRFEGRIWVEEQGHNIVRFQGTYAPRPRFGYYFHFDSWRLNMGPNLWLPAYVYVEESDMKYGFPPHRLSFKAETRFWGYAQGGQRAVETGAMPGHSDLEKLERAGLLAHAGEVEKALEGVAAQLVAANGIRLEPAVRCRVLLTAPLESFSAGHTIVESRGLLDAVPDEGTLAAVLAHELAHMVLGPEHEPGLEPVVTSKTLELLRNSLYRERLGNAALFLQTLRERGAALPNLIRAHLAGGLLLNGTPPEPMLASPSPELKRRLEQVATLPAGGRMQVDAWNSRLEFMRDAAPAAGREKALLELTPSFPRVARTSEKSGSAQGAPE